MIEDKAAFLKHRKLLSIDLINGTKRTMQIDLNIKTGTYFQIVCLMDSIKAAENNNESTYILAEIVNEILQNTNQRINVKWILENVTQEYQVELINYVFDYIGQVLSSDFYKMPDLVIDKAVASNNKIAKAHEEKRKKIQEYQEALKNDQVISLINDVVFVMKETANTYQDVMNMPIFIYRDITRNLALLNARTDDDYNLAYLKYKANMMKERLNNGDIVMDQPQKKRGADLKGLKSLLS